MSPLKSEWLLRLYPRAWRERYGDEVALLLESEPRSLRRVVDLVAGAVDARLNPQWTPHPNAARREGAMTMASLFAHCRPVGITDAEYRRSVVWMLGGTLVLALVYLGLKRMTGENVVVEAFGISAFPIVTLIASRGTYFKPYSTAAQTVLILGTGALVFALSLLAALVARLM